MIPGEWTENCYWICLKSARHFGGARISVDNSDTSRRDSLIPKKTAEQWDSYKVKHHDTEIEAYYGNEKDLYSYIVVELEF